ncbi:hypothetical protein M514_26971, partial [Trichuris suis]
MAYWSGVAKDVEEYCKSCIDCQQAKLPPPPPVPLQPASQVERPWERLGVDVLEVPMSVQGNKYLLVVQDHFTKWLEPIPLKNPNDRLDQPRTNRNYSVVWKSRPFCNPTKAPTLKATYCTKYCVRLE